MEEFILRISANASALRQELGRVGAFAKAWGTTLVEDFKSKMGRMFAAGFVLDKSLELLEKVREKVLAIARAQGELPGVGVNFVQGVFNYMEKVGLSFEEASKPLLKFKQLLDAAKKNPQGAQLEMLEHYNIVADAADLKTQKYATSVAKLSEAYLKSGKNLQVLNDLVGKQALSPALLALLELGPEKIEALGRTNIFTGLTGGNLDFYKNTFHGATGLGQVLQSTAGNLIGWVARLGGVAIALRSLVAGQDSSLRKHPLDYLKYIFTGKNKEMDDEAKLEETIQMEQQRVAIQNKLLDLKQKEREVQAQIDDRGKSSVSQMASEARRLTGLPAPRLYGMTSRLRTALNIDTLEKRAEIAWEKGNDALHNQLMAQAQQLRASNPWLTDKDRDPLAHANNELTMIRAELKPVAEMAENVNKNSK